MLDATLRGAGLGVADVLPFARQEVTYSGVVTAGDPAKAGKHARQMRLVGLTSYKVKVGLGDDVARVAAVREVIGPDAELRLDGNGAWDTPEEAAAALEQLAPFLLTCVEQPLPRGDVAAFARLRGLTGVKLMADESLVTEADAEALIAAKAVDLFNVRVSKNGGPRAIAGDRPARGRSRHRRADWQPGRRDAPCSRQRVGTWLAPSRASPLARGPMARCCSQRTSRRSPCASGTRAGLGSSLGLG